MIRGCLWVILVALGVAVALVWTLGPAIAAFVVAGALSGAGVSAASQSVAIVADPPLELLLGRADAVTVHASGATLRGVHVGDLSVSLEVVDLLSRTYDTVAATLTDASVPNGDADVLVSSITIEGSPGAATTSAKVPATEITTRIHDQVARVLPGEIRVSLSAPDRVTVEALGGTLESRLAIDARGRLILAPAGSSLVEIVVFDPASLPGVRLSSVSIVGDSVVLAGTTDVTRLVPLGG